MSENKKDKIVDVVLYSPDINKFEEGCLKLGVQIKNSEGDYLDWYDIFENLSIAWHKLVESEAEQDE